MEKLLLRPAEVAEMLGVSRSKLYGLLADGDLPAVRVGHTLRVPAEGLREWLQTRMAKQQGSPHAAAQSQPRS